MQSTLTGPTGAAMIRPTAKPRIGNSKSIIMALDAGMDAPSRAAPLRNRTILQNASFNRQSLQTRLRLHYAHELAPEANGESGALFKRAEDTGGKDRRRYPTLYNK